MQNKYFILFLSLIILNFKILVAQNLPEYLENNFYQIKEMKHNNCQHFKNSMFMQTSSLEDKPYDVLSYNLYLNWVNPFKTADSLNSKRNWWGSNEITVYLNKLDLDRIQFDAVNLLLDSFQVEDNAPQKPSIPNNGGFFDIPLGRMFFKGDELKIKLFYSYIGAANKGFYFYEKGHQINETYPNSANYIISEERLVYTMSEPQDARYWMPCNDNPNDKADATISLEVPVGITAVANGELLETYVNKALGTERSTWSSKKPITTYLMVANASKYDNWSEKLVDSATGLNLPINYYVWNQDNIPIDSSAFYNAKRSFRNIPEMLKLYSNHFVPYPYSTYGIVAVYPFPFGGMEHQTLTTIHRHWLRNNDNGNAHEIAHHWLGNLVTCADWNTIWFNEGGATWMEALWAESWGGSTWYHRYIEAERNGYLREHSIINQSQNPYRYAAITSVPVEQIFYNGGLLTYNKASFIFSMLRENIGQTKMYNLLKKLYTDYAYKNISTQEFIDFFVENTNDEPSPKIELNKFFDQWLMKAGHPVLKVQAQSYPQNDNKIKTIIDISQIQNDLMHTENFPVFDALLNMTVLLEDSTSYTTELAINKKQNDFEMTTEQKILKISFEKTVTPFEIYEIDIITNVEKEELYLNKMQIRNNLLEIKNSDAKSELELYNLLGNLVLTKSIEAVNEIVNLSELTNGVYMAKLIGPNQTKTYTFMYLE